MHGERVDCRERHLLARRIDAWRRSRDVVALVGVARRIVALAADEASRSPRRAAARSRVSRIANSESSGFITTSRSFGTSSRSTKRPTASRTRAALASSTWYSSRKIATRRDPSDAAACRSSAAACPTAPSAGAAARTLRADTSASGALSSRTSKSAGLRSSTERPRASVAIRSMVTRRFALGAGGVFAGAGVSVGVCADTAAAITSTPARRISGSTGDTETDQLLRIAVLIAGLDLDRRIHPAPASPRARRIARRRLSATA